MAVAIADAPVMFCVDADGWWPYTTTATSVGFSAMTRSAACSGVSSSPSASTMATE